MLTMLSCHSHLFFGGQVLGVGYQSSQQLGNTQPNQKSQPIIHPATQKNELEVIKKHQLSTPALKNDWIDSFSWQHRSFHPEL